MNNEVFQDRFMILQYNNWEGGQIFLTIEKDASLEFLWEYQPTRREMDSLVFLSTNSFVVGDEYKITVPNVGGCWQNIYMRGIPDIDILGKKVELQFSKNQVFKIQIISKEELLEKLNDKIKFSVNQTIQKYPSIVNKIK